LRDTTKKLVKEFLDSLGLKGENYTLKVRRPLWLRITRFVVAIIILLSIVLSPLYYYVFHYTGDLVNDRGQPLDLTKIEKNDYKKSSLVYGDGGEIIGRFFYENRDAVMSEDIPDYLKFGFIAVEDKRFNSNRPNKLWFDGFCDFLYVGIDPCAIGRAGIGHLLRAKNLSGASTIPQQYVRLLYGDEVKAFRSRERTLGRKLKEAKLAIHIFR
jgi:membrane peptidoglycan carboxypeptidase